MRTKLVQGELWSYKMSLIDHEALLKPTNALLTHARVVHAHSQIHKPSPFQTTPQLPENN